RDWLRAVPAGDGGTIRSVSAVRAAFTVRYLRHEGRPVTDLTVRIGIRSGHGLDEEQIAAVRANVREGAAYLSSPDVMPVLPDGSRAHVTVVFTDEAGPDRAASDQGEPHLTVTLTGDDQPMTLTSWRVGAAPVRYAHELAHQLGLRDSPDVDGALMGDFGRELRPEWQGHLEPDALRLRDAQLLHQLVGPHPDTTSAKAAADVTTWRKGLSFADHEKAALFDPAARFQQDVPVHATFTPAGQVPARPAPSAPVPRQEVTSVGEQLRASADFGRVDAMGRDPFGARVVPPAPDFLRPNGTAYDFGALNAERRAAFFRALDLARPQRLSADRLAPRALSADGRTVTAGAVTGRGSGFGIKQQKVPHQVHSIWFGTPLHDDGPNGSRTDFRRNITEGAGRNPGFDFVLWTDVSRAEVAEVQSADFRVETATEEQRRIRDMVDWALGSANIRIVNIDEVFSRDTPMTMQAEVLTERGRGGRSYAMASDIARVEILHRFGGVYSDGENNIHDLRRLVHDVAGRPDGFAALRDSSQRNPGDAAGRDSRRINNAAFVAVARNDATRHYLSILSANHRLTLPQLLRRAFPNLDRRGVSDDEIAQDRSPFPGLAHRHIEVVHRTGPLKLTFARLARNLGHVGTAEENEQLPGDRFRLGAIGPEAITVQGRDSWNVGFSPGWAAGQAPERAQLVRQLRQTVNDLHAEMRNRPQGVVLGPVNRAAEDLPPAYRAPFWHEALRLFGDSLGTDARNVRWIAAQDARVPGDAYQTARGLFPDARFVDDVPDEFVQSLRDEVNVALAGLGRPGTADAQTVLEHLDAVPAHVFGQPRRRVGEWIAGVIAHGRPLGVAGGARTAEETENPAGPSRRAADDGDAVQDPATTGWQAFLDDVAVPPGPGPGRGPGGPPAGPGPGGGRAGFRGGAPRGPAQARGPRGPRGVQSPAGGLARVPGGDRRSSGAARRGGARYRHGRDPARRLAAAMGRGGGRAASARDRRSRRAAGGVPGAIRSRGPARIDRTSAERRAAGPPPPPHPGTGTHTGS
ncbi:hypothetical protein ACFV23_50945, partial [Streptomyces sp. NPDC059627]